MSMTSVQAQTGSRLFRVGAVQAGTRAFTCVRTRRFEPLEELTSIHLVTPSETVHAGMPESIQRRNTSTFSFGHAPSHGIVPASSRLRIAWACLETSWCAQRSNAKIID